MGKAELEGRDWTPASTYALFILTLINTFNFFDRGLLALVLPLIKAEFKVSDTVLGAVNSLFLASAIVGVPVAAWADRWSRRNVVAISLLVWTLATALTGFAGGVMALAALRLMVGVGEAGAVPASNSMMADIFPPGPRPLALAIFSGGSSISYLLYSPPAGWIADTYGWRWVFLAAGLPGLVLALIFMLTVKEPSRHGGAAAVSKPAPPFWPSVRLLARSRAYILLLIGSACMSCINYGGGAWTTTFLVRVHHLSLTHVGAYIQPLKGLVSLVGIVLAGLLVSRLAQRDTRWRVWIPALTCLMCAPCEALFVFADPIPIWLTGFIVGGVFSLMYQGAVYSAVMEVAAPGARGTAMAVLLLVGTIVGQVIGSIGVGVLNDLLAPQFGQLAVRYSLGGVLVVSALAASLFYLAAAHYVEADAQAAAD